MEVVAGVVQLARVLARGPCIALEIWHKERWVGPFRDCRG